MLVPPLRVSSHTLRKASYAERDRTRELDPGALDFDLEAVDEDDEIEVSVADAGSTGRLHALKILQAREAIPAAGECIYYKTILQYMCIYPFTDDRCDRHVAKSGIMMEPPGPPTSGIDN